MIHILQKRPSRTQLLACLAVVLVALVAGGEAIVKQSIAQQSQQQQQQQQQQRSDDSSSSHASQSGSSASSGGQQQSTGGSAVGGQQQAAQSSSVSAVASPSSSSSYASGQASSGPKASSSSAAAPAAPSASSASVFGLDSQASNEQSYQAAASSVNLALANSGIFSGYQAAGSQQQQPQQQQLHHQQHQQASGSQLYPLTYIYYPPKDSSSSGSASGKNSGGLASLESQTGAGSQYSSMSFPTYADQMNSALQGISMPEAAASSQESSYAPVPNSYGQTSGQHQQGVYNSGDLGAYPSNIQQNGQDQPVQPVQPQHSSSPSSPPSSSSSQQHQQSHHQQQQPSSQNNVGSVSFSSSSPSGQQASPGQSGQQHDYLAGSHQLPAYQGQNIYTQMGDLSTSNYGNQPNQVSSVPSYMSPNGQQHSQQHVQQQQQQQQQVPSQASLHHAGSLLGSAANQQDLYASQAFQSGPNIVGGQQDQSISSQLFGAASSIHNQQQQPQSVQQQPQQQHPQQQQQLYQPLGAAAQQYLSQPYLTQAQYTQLTGQQLNDQGQLMSAPSQPTASLAAASSGTSKRFGLGSVIVPILALAGLSLFWPNMAQLGTAVGRKKRSIGEEKSVSSLVRRQQILFEPLNGSSQLAKENTIGEYLDKIERYYAMYNNAKENTECMDRIVCEFGDAVKDISGKTAVIAVIEKIVPSWMADKMHLFKESAMSNKDGRDKCKRFVCTSTDDTKSNRVH